MGTAQVWGVGLSASYMARRCEHPSDEYRRKCKSRKESLELWRWLGLVFWDRARAKVIMAQTEGLDLWKTGWLDSWVREGCDGRHWGDY